MTVPNTSTAKGDNALPTGTAENSREAGEQSRAASVAFIRNWPLTILSLCLFPLLLGLGSWQLQRGAEKQQMLDRIDTRLASQPQKIAQLSQLEIYTPVRLLGYYTDEYLYLDNRTRNGRAGYEILQVFSSGQQRWLVNRGWLPGKSRRSELPEVAYPRAAKVITGFLYPVGESAAEQPGVAGPGSRIQSLNRKHTAALNLRQPDWHIRISADSDTALTTDWQLINVNPQRHQGYAVQWFSMAAALFILWLLAATNIRSIIRVTKHHRRPVSTRADNNNQRPTDAARGE
ncbi:SURF1 family protein [uncultured Microbulbifer sp.]|uniref:SURF1 family protein n=1 Tax=uncultured Microbulbifer sp. TaxID=348147 RepID=UPI0025DE0A2A|nr:SURF1 family protein [uncultured Microbulbifer sp.]